MKTRILILFVLLNLALFPKLFSQNVSINSTGVLPDTSAMLDVSSTTKGFLMPRMTTVQRDAIILPATGLTIFNTTLVAYQVNTGTTTSPVWSTLNSGSGSVSSVSVTSANGVSGTVATATTTPAITLTLGAITPTSVAATGTVTGSNLSGTNTGNVTLGTANGLSLAGQALSLGTAGTSTTGALTSTDWNTFNNKAGAFSSGNLTETGSGVLTITGGTGSVIGSGTTVQVKQANTTQGGFLSNTDWNTFNNKLTTIDTTNIGSFSQKVRSLFSSTAPITYANGLIGITQATTSTNGYLSNTDWNTFNNKAAAFSSGNLTETGSGVLTITGGTGSVIGAGTTVQVKQANTTQSGFLSNTDWNTFNGKGSGNGTVTSASVVTANGVSGTVATATTTPAITLTLGAITPTSVAATGTVTGSNLSGTNTGNVTIGTANGLSLAGQALSLGTATTSTTGALTSTDWNTFNSKGSGNGTVTSASVVTANGVSGTVATATTTPAITLTLGAITPTSVAATGTVTGSNLSGTNTGNVTIGTANGLSLAGQAVSMATANTSTTGALTSTDWNTFNNKAAAFSSGNLTETGSGVLTITGGTGSVIGSGTTVQVKQAATAQNGFLSSTDWNTFNNKQPQLNGTGFVKATGTTISYDNSTYLTGNQTITFAPTGDVTGSTTGTTTIAPALVIGTNKVLNTMLAQMPTLTIKGNNTGGTANAADLTVAQVNAILPVFTSALNGLVPFSGGSAGKVLHGDGIWRDTASASNSWSITGNTGTSYLTNFLGTTDNKSLRFRTNNTQGMILDSLGNVSVGASTTTLDATNPEKFLVNAGTTSSVNAIVGKGSINSYLQLNIQNQNAGTNASSDVVATANNGNESSNYVDLGINGGSNTSGVMGVANDAYLYNLGQNFFMGTGTPAKSLIFMTGGTDSATNQRMRIDGNGNVGIGTTTPATALHVVKSNSGSNVLTLENSSTSGYSSADFLSNTNALSGTFGFANTGTGGFFGGSDYFAFYGNDFIMTADGSTAAMFVDGTNSNVGISTTTPSEKLDVAGNIKFSGALMPNNLAGTAGYVLTSNGAGTAPTWTSSPSNSWAIGGNSVASVKNIGTISNFDFPFITNNTEKMRLTSSGSLGVGTSTFNGTNPERLLVDAGTTGNTNFQNVIVGKGNTNSYAQLNIQNGNAGTGASSDVVATANNGNEATNYIDMGINSGGNTSGYMGVADDAYLYNLGQNLFIGTGTAAKSLILMTGGTDSATNERIHIDGSGNVGIGTGAPTSKVDINGSISYPITTTTGNITLNATHYTIILTAGTPSVTLPTASTCSGRMYLLVNNTAGTRTCSTYIPFGGGTATTVASGVGITVQSDGTNWYRVQ